MTQSLSITNSTLLTSTDELVRFCESLKGAPYVTIDTEFVRERTYYPVLCLVQLGRPLSAGKNGDVPAIAIDPMASDIDLQPLIDLLLDSSIVKVFHAARQDLEIFFNLCGKIPSPIIDTQVLAMVCGFGDSVSYETLAMKIAEERIDKSSRFTDWARRPLTERQIHYALSDVLHLRAIYEDLFLRTEKAGRLEWIAEEMVALTSEVTYRMAPEDAWRRLKLRSDRPRVLAVAQNLAAWREQEARSRNLPRGRILSDEAIIEIATHPPKNAEQLGHCRALSKGFAESRSGEAILKNVERALALSESEYPRIESRPVLPNGLGPLIELLRVLLKLRCDSHGVAQKLVASMSDLEQIAASDDANVPALQGWRRELFGQEALDLKRGKIALTAQGKAVSVITL